ncbi:MAG: ATP-binding protein [Kiritimatiellae bacterium]|nr:ATP-binding protein [Kiritimatiellia bacterium]
MQRKITQKLQKWAEKSNRKPLVIKGARQVGKTWAIKDFGNRFFAKTAYFNFDENSDLIPIFDIKDTQEIIRLLEYIAGFKFIPSETLIIFDEIQQCPNALNALKYFKENAPQYFIIAAGSLLGTYLAKPKTYPVGMVELIEMYPLDFEEFLEATDQNLFEIYKDLKLDEEVQAIFHRKLSAACHDYMIVGGMPECVAAWNQNRDIEQIRGMQQTLIEFYEGDFAKHVDSSIAERCRHVWRSIPAQLAKANERFFYGTVKSGARAREYEEAVSWVVHAGLMNRIYNVQKIEMPLRAYSELSQFKLFLHDTGLLCRLAGVNPADIALGNDYPFKGKVSENYVLQQLIGKTDIEPFYFMDDHSREIDFIVQSSNGIVPIEVKSGDNVRSISLSNYIKKRNPPLAIRFSEKNCGNSGGILSLPLYMTCKLESLLR